MRRPSCSARIESKSSDQSYLGDNILTSALKQVNVAEKDSVKRAQDGEFRGGSDASEPSRSAPAVLANS